jgi:hypothetical protein
VIASPLATALLKYGLLDELLLFIYPVILGKGRPLFDDFSVVIGCELLEQANARTGSVRAARPLTATQVPSAWARAAHRARRISFQPLRGVSVQRFSGRMRTAGSLNASIRSSARALGLRASHSASRSACRASTTRTPNASSNCRFPA